MRQKLLMIAGFILVSCAAFAQFSSKKKGSLIGFHFSVVDFTTPHEIDSTSLHDVLQSGHFFGMQRVAPAFSLSYWKGLTDHIDLSVKATGIYRRFAAATKEGQEFGGEMEGALNLRLLNDAHFLNPFVTGGIGAGIYSGSFSTFIPLGLGLQFNFGSESYIFLQSNYRQAIRSVAAPSSLAYSIGAALNVSRPKQEKKVLPPPPPVVSDRDGDGVVDSLDACPDTPGLASLKGCPDRDGDGIADKDDKCPDVAGLAKYNGCPIPDTDGDGINDEQDKCPTVPGVARYNGCPVPDRDNDGVNDEEDKCPDVAGPASNFGCPVIEKATTEKVNTAAKNIFFATGSAKLLAKSNSSLNQVISLLKENPTYKLSVEGYTDNTGKTDKNQVLSESRANAVKTYIVAKGIDTSRITATGYGQEKPVASNKTAAGRAKNRRVELKLSSY